MPETDSTGNKGAGVSRWDNTRHALIGISSGADSAQNALLKPDGERIARTYVQAIEKRLVAVKAALFARGE